MAIISLQMWISPVLLECPSLYQQLRATWICYVDLLRAGNIACAIAVWLAVLDRALSAHA